MTDKGGAPPTYNPQPGMYPPLQQPPEGAHYQQQPGVTVVQVGDPSGVYVKWSWCNVVMAAISVFCCQCLGMAALIAAMLAYVDHKVKDFQRSAHKQKIARGCAIAAIVIGSIFIIIIIIAYAAAIAAVVKASKDNRYGDGNYGK